MLEVKNISKQFVSGKSKVSALNNVNLKVEKSEFILIKGESGSGKSTLLFIMGGMLNPTSGDVVVNDENIVTLSEKERGKYRANEIGFVFQSYHLLPYLNVFENIMLPNELADSKVNEEDVYRLVEELGIKDRLFHKPSQLSAGEKTTCGFGKSINFKSLFNFSR